jgi:hypothetical protein
MIDGILLGAAYLAAYFGALLLVIWIVDYTLGEVNTESTKDRD